MAMLVRVFSALMLGVLVNSQKAIQEGTWRHMRDFDDVTSPSTALWTQEMCVSRLRCVTLCSSRSTCNAVFHDPTSSQCHGHRGLVKVKNTRPKVGTTFLIRRSTLIETFSPKRGHRQRLSSQSTEATADPQYHTDHFNNMVYYVYRKKLTWLDAETFCEEKGERLIRLDTAAKRKSIREFLASKKNYRGRKAFVAGYVYTKDDIYWDSSMKEQVPADVVTRRRRMVRSMETLGCYVRSDTHQDKLPTYYRGKKAMVAGYRYDEDAIFWGSRMREPVTEDIIAPSLMTNKVVIYGCFVTSKDKREKLRLTRDIYDGDLIICERTVRI